ncbi:hypothetical protein PENSPDRAFT_131582 [Peniophora sp. CONT]|nr:hypothetical protein PENSPDRAFT_131582 [Peniophora sp. CONT]
MTMISLFRRSWQSICPDDVEKGEYLPCPRIPEGPVECMQDMWMSMKSWVCLSPNPRPAESLHDSQGKQGSFSSFYNLVGFCLHCKKRSNSDCVQTTFSGAMCMEVVAVTLTGNAPATNILSMATSCAAVGCFTAMAALSCRHEPHSGLAILTPCCAAMGTVCMLATTLGRATTVLTAVFIIASIGFVLYARFCGRFREREWTIRSWDWKRAARSRPMLGYDTM